MAEAASELRRHALDRLRAGDLERAESLLATMDEVFGTLAAIDLPDALTGGLRRTLDGLRAVVERTRGDVTNAVLQGRLAAGPGGSAILSAPAGGVAQLVERNNRTVEARGSIPRTSTQRP